MGEIAQSSVCSLFPIHERDHAPEQGKILMDPAAVSTVSFLMSRLISPTLTEQQPAASTSAPGKTLLLQMLSMPDDRQQRLLRAVDSRSRRVYIPFQGHKFWTHSAIHPYQIRLIPVCTSLYNSHSLGQCQELN